MPADSWVVLNTTATHCNPNHWPSARASDPYADLETFRPERWLTSTPSPNGKVDNHTEADGDTSANEMSGGLYRPQRGAYLPFGEGAHACMGRRFAQVELMAVLALVFKHYSAELAVDSFASDDEGRRGR